MTFKNKTALTLLTTICLSLLITLPVYAAWPETKLIPSCATSPEGRCGFNDFILLGVNLSKMILGIVGSLALLFFVYGGIMFLLAGGKSEMIEKGKKIITNAVIGIALVLGAWLIINFTIAALTGTPVGQVKIFGTQEWWKTPGAAPSGEEGSKAGGTTTPPADSGATTPPAGGTP